jgi:hypothetical protein
MMLPDKQSKTMVSRFSAAVIEQHLSIAERANPLTSAQPESWGQWTRNKSKCQSDRDSLIIHHFPNEMNGKLICSHYNGRGWDKWKAQ